MNEVVLSRKPEEIVAKLEPLARSATPQVAAGAQAAIDLIRDLMDPQCEVNFDDYSALRT